MAVIGVSAANLRLTAARNIEEADSIMVRYSRGDFNPVDFQAKMAFAQGLYAQATAYLAYAASLDTLGAVR